MKGKNIKIIEEKLKNVYDIRYRDIHGAGEFIHIVYCKTMCDHQYTSMHIIRPIINNKSNIPNLKYLKENVITACSIGETLSLEEAIAHIIAGHAAITMDNCEEILFCETRGFNTRAVEIPPTESVIKGPREGFNESLDDGISLIRQRIKETNLKVEYIGVESEAKTAVVMLYLENIAPKNLVNNIKRKLQSIKTKSIIYSNTIEEILKSKNTPFDTIGYTEKPDLASTKIKEGRVIILTNGTPFAVIAPYFFVENFHTSDDYTLNKYVSC